MFDVNWEARSHADIHAQLQGRGGGFTDAGGAWNQLASRLRDVAGTVERATGGIAATRTGVAAQAAQGSVGPMGAWAAEARTFSDSVGAVSYEQNRALASTRAAVGPPVARPPVPLSTWEGVGALAALDVDSAERTSSDAANRARAAMGRYQEFSSLRASELPRFAAPTQGPPQVGVAVPGAGVPGGGGVSAAPGGRVGAGGAAVPGGAAGSVGGVGPGGVPGAGGLGGTGGPPGSGGAAGPGGSGGAAGPGGAVPGGAPGAGGSPGTGGAAAPGGLAPGSPVVPGGSGTGSGGGGAVVPGAATTAPGTVPSRPGPVVPGASGPAGTGPGGGAGGARSPSGGGLRGTAADGGFGPPGSTGTGPGSAGTGLGNTGTAGAGAATGAGGTGTSGTGLGSTGTGGPGLGSTGQGSTPTAGTRPSLEPGLRPGGSGSVLEPALGGRAAATAAERGAMPIAPLGGMGGSAPGGQRLPRAAYLVEDDPDAITGGLPRVVPPVIGDDRS